jgi:hypothetical protein
MPEKRERMIGSNLWFSLPFASSSSVPPRHRENLERLEYLPAEFKCIAGAKGATQKVGGTNFDS